ncbi:somatic embryogenesis receptor kinase 1-like [Syzygium oleosum]|uniref:somatic embryogenesis receptor kinase 1-like n=1 Tax=Syzygium oleosum TaxID=219896 RepID=UPI0011D2C6BA|nr:somatic embryogenesis receptor kinase 1-like [Syzygium oleosum]
MVFRFATFDPVQDPDDFNPAFPPTPSSSPSVALCQPCEYTCTFTKTIVTRLVSAGASLVLAAPAFEFHDDEIRDRFTETPFHGINFDVRPEFHQRQLKEFTLKELKAATRNFSNKRVIGRGGFGEVYEGQLADGSLVAIKRCNAQSNRGILGYKREVMIGSIVPPRHNLLPMVGFCGTPKCRELILVCPLMINRSAASCLRERPEAQPPLDWPTRRKIAAGAARGLSHLHDLNIVHRDIKAANILLDEEFEPHIGDFGLAKFIHRRHGGYFEDGIEEAAVLPRNKSEGGSHGEYSDDTTAICGTRGHIAPEYIITGKCSVTNDVFGFGIMLLELLSGQSACDLARLADDADMGLLDWVKGLLVERRWAILVDPDLQGEFEEEIEKVIQLALLCTQIDPRERPSMAQVVRILEGHSIEGRWEKYYLKYQHLSWNFGRLQGNADVSSSLLIPEELSEPR